MDEAVGWLVAVGFCYFTFKYLFGSPSTPTRRQVPQAQIDQVSTMFPGISVAAIRYELERTGSVDLTVDRALREGRLPDPPAGFFVDPSATPAPAPAPRAPHPPAATTATAGTPASLISRLGLQSRLADSGSLTIDGDEKGKGKEREKVGWETNAEARERSLKERKAKMVLEARRKLLEKEKARKEKATASTE